MRPPRERRHTGGHTATVATTVDCLAMDTQVADTLLGTLIDGRYHVRGRVARGGMATVYTATDERLGRTVAIKIIHPSQARDPRFVDRFIEEAKTIARLTHPNVVAVYDQGTHAGMPYLVTEYVRGRTLRDILAERRRLSPSEALAIMEQTLAAVAAAHRAGLVHRDVKPENVLVAEAPSGGAANLVDAVVKVADFGLARAVEASSDDPAGGHLMATVAYVAPELVTHGHADARTDVYSAGIVLFEMLTGRVPYGGSQPVEVAWQHVDRDVPAPSAYVPGLPPVLDELVARATRRDPGARPTDAGALLAEVQVAREDLGASNAATTLLRPIAAPTVVVAPVQSPQRPPWARLPEARPAPHRRAVSTAPSWRDRLRDLHRRVVAHPRGRAGLVAACVAVGLLVAVGGWWFGIGRYTVAPQFVNLPKAQAVQKAQAAGFTVKFDGRYDEKIAKDTVVGQRPAASARIIKGGTITLTVSLGPERYQVPDIVGKTYELAVVDLQQRKLVPERKDRYDDNMPAGNVLTVEPAVNTEVKPGTKVVVWVSRGKAPLTVPNVIGRNADEARTVLQNMGLLVTVEEKDSTKPKGQVLEQSPPDGAGVEPGATIKLVVSKGPGQIPVPDVTSAHNIPCAQAAQMIQAANLTPKVFGNTSAVAQFQQPPANTPVDPGAEVNIICGP